MKKKKWKDTKKENKLGIIVLIISIVICIISVSYAFWANRFTGNKEQSLTTAVTTLDLIIDEESEGISLLNAVPVSDATGLTYVPYTFKLKNRSNYNISYNMYLVDDDVSYIADGCTDNKLDHSNIKYALGVDQNPSVIGNLSTNNDLIQNSTMSGKSVKSFSLRIWIKKEATNEIMRKHFHGKIKVEATMVR